MKKILLLFGFLCVFVMVTRAQEQSPNCHFKVHVSSVDASCFNNGLLIYYLENVDGGIMTESEFIHSGLSRVRIYTKVNETDSIHYDGFYYKGGLDTFMVDHGTYYVGVEGACEDGQGGFIMVDTVLEDRITINTSYVVPLVSTLFVIDSVGTNFGRHSTLECTNMGLVQLRIENGNFPYTIQVKPHGNQDSVFRTVVFDGYQHEGTDSTRTDYWKYYTIDTMPAGDWDFYVVDGCDYGLPRSGQIVDVVSFPYLDYVEMYASSGTMTDSNVIKIRANIYSPYDYYTEMIPDYVKYRFVYRQNGVWSDPGEDSWKVFPASNKVILYDTASVNYCDLDSIRFEYKVENTPGGCSDTLIQRTFKYSKPNPSKFPKKKVMASDEVVRDGCREYMHEFCDYYSIQYSEFSPNYVSREEHETHRYHYTHPLTWIYIDNDSANGDTIKTEYVSAINVPSKLFASEVEARYGPLPQTLHVTRKLVDAMGCELYNTGNMELVYDEIVDTVKPRWTIESAGTNHCCSAEHRITLKGTYSEGINPDSTKIELVSSPDNNIYNFTATYHAFTNSWEVNKHDIRNRATISGANGKTLDLKGFCLVSGQYVFNIYSPCDTIILTKNITFPDQYTTELTQAVAKTIEKECTDWYITYTQGQLSRIGHNKDNAGHDVSHVTPLETRFQVVDGPLGGYDNVWYEVDDRIRLSIPGTYVVKIFPTTSHEICEYEPIYDTIYFENTTVEHLYAYAVLCDVGDTSGHVYVKGINGIPPYTYTLYSHANKEGVVLGSNSNGTFYDVSMRTDTALSCLIEDNCGAYFHVNFFPELLANLQITWFDNGLRAITTCEGSTVGVHTLTSQNIIQYVWTGPNGFFYVGPEPQIFIARGADPGWYKVQVLMTDCGNMRLLEDSIEIKVTPSPTVTIQESAVVCPGETVQLTFTPRSYHIPAPIVDFSLAFETATSREIRNYSSLSGVPVRDSISTMVPMKIYPVNIQDDECGYPFADSWDTIYVSISNNVIHSCDIFTIDDYVCHDNDATLQAQSTIDYPYIIRWYSDMDQTQLLKEDNIANAEDWSTYDTSHIIQRTLLYVSVDKDGYCPSVNSSYTDIINMREDTINMNCAQSYRVFDSGGMNGDYGTGEMIKQTFIADSGRKVVMIIDRDSWDLSNTSTLLVISGTELEPDSVMYELTKGGYLPEIIISKGSALTLFFMSGEIAAGGWSALVEPMPGVAIADAYPPNQTNLYDEVCQSSSLEYEDIYHVSPWLVSQTELNEAVKRAGLHVFTHNFEGQDQHQCDSVVIFSLMVNDPPFVDTMVVTTNFLLNGQPYHWKGMDLDSTGRYSKINTMTDGCDSLDILSLVILQIDTSDNEICDGESTIMGISVETPRLIWKEGEIPPVKAPGDVLCTDGSVLRVDAFLESGKTPVGVVYYIDPTGEHGKIIALKDAPIVTINGKINYYGIWAQDQEKAKSIHAVNKCTDQKDALFDMRGKANTQAIKASAENIDDSVDPERAFLYYAPAAYYCYYYNESSGVVDPSNPEGWGWYLPAMGELNILFGNRVPVNATLKKLKERGYAAEELDNGKNYYLSSSEAGKASDNTICWHNDYSGHFVSHQKISSYTSNKNAYHIVRPSRDF